jgi:hypothetical protein
MVPLRRLTELKKPLAAVHESGDVRMLRASGEGMAPSALFNGYRWSAPRCRNAFVLLKQIPRRSIRMARSSP